MRIEEPSEESKKEEKGAEIKFKWNGTWVACDKCPDAKKADIPKRGFGENVPSDNLFEVEGTARPVDSDDDAGQPHVASVVEGEGYDMEGDDGKTSKHKDDKHEIYLPNLKWTGDLRDQRINLVFAMGNNEFGSFISVGWMRPGNRLTLGRRYLDEKDSRIKWGVEEFRAAVLEEIVLEGNKVVTPPWQCAALHSDLVPAPKKQKVEKNTEK